MQRRASATFATLIQFFLGSALLAGSGGARAADFGPGTWAAENDPVARQLIEQERRWGVDACEPSTVVAEFLAEDFIGTSPSGQLYAKATMLPAPGSPPPKITERNCKLISAKVRFYGPDLAVIYGSESADFRSSRGKTVTRVLIWTDTVLRRDGKWQVIAVQDMVAPPGWTPAKWDPAK
jgi:Domain of unknown function (DUF4440)